MVLPISFFERAGCACFNSLAVLDADGANLGIYRKSHIPNGPGYQEKTYFSPGDTGLQSVEYALCAHRRRHLLGSVVSGDRPRHGADGGGAVLLPTAIGSEPPPAPPVNSREHWQRTQQGHAAANLMPLVAANRYGLERSLQDPQSSTSASTAPRSLPTGWARRWPRRRRRAMRCCVHTFDLEEVAQLRDNWFVFRDRRPDLYGAIGSLDGALGGMKVARTTCGAAALEILSRRRFPALSGREPPLVEAGGQHPAAFAAAWTMPSSACPKDVDAERVIRPSEDLSRILVPAPEALSPFGGSMSLYRAGLKLALFLPLGVAMPPRGGVRFHRCELRSQPGLTAWCDP